MRSYSDLSRQKLYDRLLILADAQLGIAGEDYSKYQDNPVGFCEEILKETLTDDVKVLMESVRDNPITVAKSANANCEDRATVSLESFPCFSDNCRSRSCGLD